MTDPTTQAVADYEEVLSGHRQLVRDLDQLLNGKDAAPQASLCDIVGQVARYERMFDMPIVKVLDAMLAAEDEFDRKRDKANG